MNVVKQRAVPVVLRPGVNLVFYRATCSSLGSNTSGQVDFSSTPYSNQVSRILPGYTPNPCVTPGLPVFFPETLS